jgi:hypothetical protein
VDVAAKAAVMASSTANAISHGVGLFDTQPRVCVSLCECVRVFFSGAAMAVDDSAATFWASKFDDTKDPVEYVIDFGEVQKLHSVELSWEFPARAFSVSLSTDGDHFTEAFATDANVLKSSQVMLGSTPARKMRIVMYEAGQ